MNRPNATDEKYLKGYDVMSYQKDLELYCDILEECIKTDNIGMEQERDYYRKKIEKLENMLNDSFQGHLLKVIIPRLEREIENQKVKIQNLVERAEPKKPIYEADGYADGELVYDTWLCPNCEKDYEVDYDKYDYCPNCGQKLDWSDTNED